MNYFFLQCPCADWGPRNLQCVQCKNAMSGQLNTRHDTNMLQHQLRSHATQQLCANKELAAPVLFRTLWMQNYVTSSALQLQKWQCIAKTKTCLEMIKKLTKFRRLLDLFKCSEASPKSDWLSSIWNSISFIVHFYASQKSIEYNELCLEQACLNIS